MPVPTDPYPNFVPLTTADADQVDARFQRLYDTLDPAQVGIDLANLAQSLRDLLVPTGTILSTACATPPSTQYLMCDGAEVSRSTYVNLWNAIRAGHAGTAGDPAPYGNGNATTTFNVPDLRGRAAIGAGTGTGLSARSPGVKVGGERVTLDAMPNHDHGGVSGDDVSRHTHNYVNPAASYNIAELSGTGPIWFNASPGPASVTNSGFDNERHKHGIGAQGGGVLNQYGGIDGNMSPAQVVNYMIKV